MLFGIPNCGMDATGSTLLAIPRPPGTPLRAIVGGRVSCQLVRDRTRQLPLQAPTRAALEPSKGTRACTGCFSNEALECASS